MTEHREQRAPVEAAQEDDYQRQTRAWERVASELRALAEEHGEGFVVSEAALAALDELTTMDTVPAEFPPMARSAVRG